MIRKKNWNPRYFSNSSIYKEALLIYLVINYGVFFTEIMFFVGCFEITSILHLMRIVVENQRKQHPLLEKVVGFKRRLNLL